MQGSTVFCRLGEKRELKRPATENDVDNVETKKKAKITVEDRLGITMIVFVYMAVYVFQLK